MCVCSDHTHPHPQRTSALGDPDLYAAFNFFPSLTNFSYAAVACDSCPNASPTGSSFVLPAPLHVGRYQLSVHGFCCDATAFKITATTQFEHSGVQNEAVAPVGVVIGFSALVIGAVMGLALGAVWLRRKWAERRAAVHAGGAAVAGAVALGGMPLGGGGGGGGGVRSSRLVVNAGAPASPPVAGYRLGGGGEVMVPVPVMVAGGGGVVQTGAPMSIVPSTQASPPPASVASTAPHAPLVNVDQPASDAPVQVHLDPHGEVRYLGGGCLLACLAPSFLITCFGVRAVPRRRGKPLAYGAVQLTVSTKLTLFCHFVAPSLIVFHRTFANHSCYM
jgi:hypothetical protein